MARRLKTLAIFSLGGLATYGTMQTLQSVDTSAWPSSITSSPLSAFLKSPTTIPESPLASVPKPAPNAQLSNANYLPAVEASLSKLNQWRAANQIPGYVIGLSIKGQTVWIHGDGYANIENDLPCTPNTVMRIASISKSITAALLGKMMQEGKIDLDKPIRTYLTAEQFPDKTWEGEKVDITLRQLVSHLGGIRHYKKPEKPQNGPRNGANANGSANDEFANAEYYLYQRFPTVLDSLSLFKDDPLVAKPGSKYVYTTFGWTLISAVMETQLEPKNFTRALTNFVRDLGMRSTYLDENLPIIYNRSAYYFIDPKSGRLKNVPAVDNSYKWAGGGLLSTAGDLLRFGNAMLYSFKGADAQGRPGFLSKEIVDQMWTAAPVTVEERSGAGGYGIGWAVLRDEKAKAAYTAEPRFNSLFSHSGAAIGASSLLLVEPEQEIILAIIINLQAAGELYRIGYDVMEAFQKQAATLSGEPMGKGGKKEIEYKVAA